MNIYKNVSYTNGPTVNNTSDDPLQFCLDIANAEILDHIPFRISFVDYVYKLYLTLFRAKVKMDWVQGFPKNASTLEWTLRKCKHLTKRQFIKRLDPRVQKLISLKSPVGWAG